MEDKKVLIDQSSPLLPFLDNAANLFNGDENVYHIPFLLKKHSPGKLELIKFNDALDWIKEKIALPVSLWVDVLDEIPLDDTSVLIWQLNNDRAVPATFKRGEFERYNNSIEGDRCGVFQYINVTHWQYLPKLPTPPLT